MVCCFFSPRLDGWLTVLLSRLAVNEPTIGQFTCLLLSRLHGYFFYLIARSLLFSNQQEKLVNKFSLKVQKCNAKTLLNWILTLLHVFQVLQLLHSNSLRLLNACLWVATVRRALHLNLNLCCSEMCHCTSTDVVVVSCLPHFPTAIVFTVYGAQKLSISFCTTCFV